MNFKNFQENFKHCENYKSYGYLDLDNFTNLNLKRGFEHGNKILIDLPKLIKETINTEIILRVDSDEFLFACTENFNIIKENIFKLLQNIEIKLDCTASIGITTPYPKENLRDLLKRLKENVLLAKQNGKNIICYK